MKSKISFLVIFLLALCISVNAKDYSAASPDGKINLSVQISDGIFWSVQVDGRQVLTPSRIALDMGGEVLGVNPKVRKYEKKEVNETIQAVVSYKFRNVEDHCDELLLTFRGDYALRFRVYNNGAAYRIESGIDDEIIIAPGEIRDNISNQDNEGGQFDDSFF